MKRLLSCLLVLYTTLANGQEQKIVGDCTVTFSISGSDAAVNANLSSAVKTFYIRGKLSRVDVSSNNYQKQSVIYNVTTGEAVKLQEVGANKYMTKLTAEKWNLENSRYLGAKFTFSGETKTILGYPCKKGVALLKDGGSFTFYYATDIMPSATEIPYLYKEIPGFVLQYELSEKNNNLVITYTATKINFSPVPASNFDIPTSGYLVRDN